MFGNRGIYHKGWTAVTKHRTPWDRRRQVPPSTTTLGAVRHDDGLDPVEDLAKEQPEKLHDLQRLWLIEATKYNVLPLDDRSSRRFNRTAGRPQLVRGNRQISSADGLPQRELRS